MELIFGGLEMRALKEFHGVSLYALMFEPRKQSVGRLVMEEFDECSHPEPTTRLNETQAQVLMDTLWDCGVRPTEGSGSAGALSAVQKHLGDMRVIAGKKLGVDL